MQLVGTAMGLAIHFKFEQMHSGHHMCAGEPPGGTVVERQVLQACKRVSHSCTCAFYIVCGKRTVKSLCNIHLASWVDLATVVPKWRAA